MLYSGTLSEGWILIAVGAELALSGALRSAQPSLVQKWKRVRFSCTEIHLVSLLSKNVQTLRGYFVLSFFLFVLSWLKLRTDSEIVACSWIWICWEFKCVCWLCCSAGRVFSYNSIPFFFLLFNVYLYILMPAAQVSRKLTFLYLANDVIQNSKRKGPEFTQDFAPVIVDAFKHVYRSGFGFGKIIVRLTCFRLEWFNSVTSWTYFRGLAEAKHRKCSFVTFFILCCPDISLPKMLKANVFVLCAFGPERARRAVRNSWVGFYPSGKRELSMRTTCSISSRKSCVSPYNTNPYRLVSNCNTQQCLFF